MKKLTFALLCVAAIVATALPSSAGISLPGNTVDLSSGLYQQGGVGKWDRQALIGSDGPLSGSGSNTNVVAELYAFTDNAQMQNSGFGRYNSITTRPGLNPGTDGVGWIMYKLTNMPALPDVYVLMGTTESGANQVGFAEGWIFQSDVTGKITVRVDMGVSFPDGPAARYDNPGVWYSFDWDGFSVDSLDVPSGTWTQAVQFRNFPDAWHQPFKDFTVPAGITDDFQKDYNGEGTNGIGSGQHPGQGYGDPSNPFAHFTTAADANGVVRGVDVYVRGAHGSIYYERRPTYGYITPEPSSLIALLGGMGAFAGLSLKRRSK